MDGLSLLAILGLGIYFLTFLALYLQGHFALFFTYLLFVILTIPILIFGKRFSAKYGSLKLLFDNFEGYKVYLMLNESEKNGYYIGNNIIIVTEPVIDDQDRLYFVIYHEIGHSIRRKSIAERTLYYLSPSILFGLFANKLLRGINIYLEDSFAIAYLTSAFFLILVLLLYALLGVVGFVVFLIVLPISPFMDKAVPLLMLAHIFIDPSEISYFLAFLSFVFYNIYNSLIEINADLYVIKRLGQKG